MTAIAIDVAELESKVKDMYRAVTERSAISAFVKPCATS